MYINLLKLDLDNSTKKHLEVIKEVKVQISKSATKFLIIPKEFF